MKYSNPMRASYFSFCAGTLLMLVCAACQGRTADATPNGETVEVDIRAAESATDTLPATPQTAADTAGTHAGTTVIKIN